MGLEIEIETVKYNFVVRILDVAWCKEVQASQSSLISHKYYPESSLYFTRDPRWGASWLSCPREYLSRKRGERGEPWPWYPLPSNQPRVGRHDCLPADVVPSCCVVVSGAVFGLTYFSLCVSCPARVRGCVECVCVSVLRGFVCEIVRCVFDLMVGWG